MFTNKDKLLEQYGYKMELESFEQAVEQDIILSMKLKNTFLEVHWGYLSDKAREKVKQDLQAAGYNVSKINQYVTPFVEDATETGIRISW